MIRSIAALAALLMLPAFRAPGQVKPASIVINESGVGGLNSATICRLPVIAKLFPGFRVVAAVDMSEGIEFPIIEVRDRLGVVLEIIPQEEVIRVVIAKRKLVTHTGRGQIGSFYPEVFGTTYSTTCQEGGEEYSDRIICPAPGSKSIHLVFSGPFNPYSPSVSALKKMKVTEIFWAPPRTGK